MWGSISFARSVSGMDLRAGAIAWQGFWSRRRFVLDATDLVDGLCVELLVPFPNEGWWSGAHRPVSRETADTELARCRSPPADVPLGMGRRPDLGGASRQAWASGRAVWPVRVVPRVAERRSSGQNTRPDGFMRVVPWLSILRRPECFLRVVVFGTH